MLLYLLSSDGPNTLVTNTDVARNVNRKLETNNSRDTRHVHSEQPGTSATVDSVIIPSQLPETLTTSSRNDMENQYTIKKPITMKRWISGISENNVPETAANGRPTDDQFKSTLIDPVNWSNTIETDKLRSITFV